MSCVELRNAARTPLRDERVDLILHQRDQRRHDDADARPHERGDLVAERLAAAGRHQHERVAAGRRRGRRSRPARRGTRRSRRPGRGSSAGEARACRSRPRLDRTRPPPGRTARVRVKRATGAVPCVARARRCGRRDPRHRRSARRATPRRGDRRRVPRTVTPAAARRAQSASTSSTRSARCAAPGSTGGWERALARGGIHSITSSSRPPPRSSSA